MWQLYALHTSNGELDPATVLGSTHVQKCVCVFRSLYPMTPPRNDLLIVKLTQNVSVTVIRFAHVKLRIGPSNSLCTWMWILMSHTALSHTHTHSKIFINTYLYVLKLVDCRVLRFLLTSESSVKSSLWNSLEYDKTTQLAHDVRTTLYGRWNDVKTLKRRRSNVVLTLCASWEMESL